MLAATWTRESHGLYDYETKQPIKTRLDIEQPTHIIRRNSTVTGEPPTNGPVTDPEMEGLGRVVVRNDQFFIDTVRVGEPRQRQGKLWRVVKDLANGYTLGVGDSVKLGRFKLKVRQIETGFGGKMEKVTRGDGVDELVPAKTVAKIEPAGGAQTTRPLSTSPEALEALDHTPCRICLLEGSSPEDPLIRPCDCKGTIE